jgi:hypothetical protein
MTRLLLATTIVGALFAGGCRKATPEKACKHLKALASAQVDREIKRMNGYGRGGEAVGLAADVKQKAKDFDVDACAAGLEAKGVDPNCVADAATVIEAAACMRKSAD